MGWTTQAPLSWSSRPIDKVEWFSRSFGEFDRIKSGVQAVGMAESKREWLLVAAIIAATFVAYKPCWHGNYLLDDQSHLLHNPVLKPGGLAKAWVPGSYLNYWPLTFTFYRLEHELWGFDRLGYHLVNIALHAISAVLIWRILRRLGMTGALFAAAIFALHPVNVESVAWISQLKTVLSVALALTSLLFYLRFETNHRRWNYAAALVAFVLSALAKGDALTLPIVLLALAWWQRDQVQRSDLLRTIPFFLVAACMATLEVISQHSVGSVPVRSDGILSRAAIAGCAVWFYLGKLVWPIDLIPVYPRWSIPAANLLWYLPALALAGLLVIGWKERRSGGKPIVMFIFCYVALLLPVLGFVNISYMRYSLVADHWQYVATIIPCAAVGAVGAWLVRRSFPRLVQFGCLALLGGLSVVTWQQSALYRDPTYFLTQTLVRNPEASLAECGLGEILSARGDPTDIDHFRKAVRLAPDDPESLGSLGAALGDRGEFDLAIPYLNRALELNPKTWGPNYNLAQIEAHRRQIDLAIDHLRRELEIRPGYEPAQRLLSAILADREKVARQIKQLRSLIEKHPTDVLLLINAAWILSTDPNASLRDGPAALKYAERAAKISGGDDPRAFDVLAAAYAEVGQFTDASLAEKRAIQLTTDEVMTKQLQQRLELYDSRKPYRDLRAH